MPLPTSLSDTDLPNGSGSNGTLSLWRRHAIRRRRGPYLGSSSSQEEEETENLLSAGNSANHDSESSSSDGEFVWNDPELQASTYTPNRSTVAISLSSMLNRLARTQFNERGQNQHRAPDFSHRERHVNFAEIGDETEGHSSPVQVKHAAQKQTEQPYVDTIFTDHQFHINLCEPNERTIRVKMTNLLKLRLQELLRAMRQTKLERKRKRGRHTQSNVISHTSFLQKGMLFQCSGDRNARPMELKVHQVDFKEQSMNGHIALVGAEFGGRLPFKGKLIDFVHYGLFENLDHFHLLADQNWSGLYGDSSNESFSAGIEDSDAEQTRNDFEDRLNTTSRSEKTKTILLNWFRLPPFNKNLNFDDFKRLLVCPACIKTLLENFCLMELTIDMAAADSRTSTDLKMFISLNRLNGEIHMVAGNSDAEDEELEQNERKALYRLFQVIKEPLLKDKDTEGLRRIENGELVMHLMTPRPTRTSEERESNTESWSISRYKRQKIKNKGGSSVRNSSDIYHDEIIKEFHVNKYGFDGRYVTKFLPCAQAQNEKAELEPFTLYSFDYC